MIPVLACGAAEPVAIIFIPFYLTHLAACFAAMVGTILLARSDRELTTAAVLVGWGVILLGVGELALSNTTLTGNVLPMVDELIKYFTGGVLTAERALWVGRLTVPPSVGLLIWRWYNRLAAPSPRRRLRRSPHLRKRGETAGAPLRAK